MLSDSNQIACPRCTPPGDPSCPYCEGTYGVPAPPSDECPICGSGHFLPSGVCDHCNQPRGTEPVTYRKSTPDMVMTAVQNLQREVLTERARAERFKRALEELVDGSTRKELEGMAAFLRTAPHVDATKCLQAVEVLLAEFPKEEAKP